MEPKYIPSPITCYPIRLQPGQEIKGQLLDFSRRNKLQASFVLSCVGSVTNVSLRMADSKTRNLNMKSEWRDEHFGVLCIKQRGRIWRHEDLQSTMSRRERFARCKLLEVTPLCIQMRKRQRKIIRYDIGGPLYMPDFQIKHYSGHFEVVSLVGTISDGGHLHTSLSDEDGNVFGGHVIGNMTVYTTAEIMIGECTGAIFSREQDEKTGYKELIVQNKE